MSEPSIYSINNKDIHWPKLLKELPPKAQPKSLFVRGELPPADSLIIGIVGTRRPSRYGKDAAHEITQSLAKHHIAIASGLAIGIDTIAHKTALDAGTPTIAVLGCGLDERVLYPKENLELMRKIAANNGAVISEYEPHQKPELWTFPQRNRIIAGISKAIVVIEAGEKSGALITARFALEFGREVFALPGSIYNSQSQGTNKLIKQGATPITSAHDILEALGIEQEKELAPSKKSSPEESKILTALDEERALDEIIKITKLPASTVLACTSSLEIHGMIKALGGGIYRKL